MSSFNLKDAFSTSSDSETEDASEQTQAEFIEKDVESPDVFAATEAGLWDGRPSLGGVWVAHPEVREPERVMIRNQANGQFVVGALFRREREVPGPRLQVSSDAANALSILAGAPVELEVVALRKERIPVAPPEPPAEVADATETGIEEPAEIQETTLGTVAIASAAIDDAEPTPVEIAPVTGAPTVQSSLPVSRLEKPYIQVGIFNRETNANRAAEQMRNAGMVPSVRSQTSSGKAFWRVIVGPAATSSERKLLQQQIVAVGYSDAYPVTN